MNQNERILTALKRGPLTALGAQKEHAIMRLAARVHDLRAAGHEIRDRWVHVRNRWGDFVRVKAYWVE